METNTKIILSAFVLFVIIVYFISRKSQLEGMYGCGKYTECDTPQIYNFIHRTASIAYNDLVKELGDPNVLVDKPSGIAIWNQPAFFDEIILRDESVQSMVPFVHCEFLYATINVYVPEVMIPIVLSLSESIVYDRLKRTLTARAGNMGMVVATLHLAMRMLGNPNTAEDIKRQRDYVLRDSSDPLNYRALYDELKVMVTQNQSLYSRFMPYTQCTDSIDKNLIRRLI